jgi:hypothetical protein
MLLAPFGSERSDEHRRMVETNLIGAMTATEVFLDQRRHGPDRGCDFGVDPVICRGRHARST